MTRTVFVVVLVLVGSASSAQALSTRALGTPAQSATAEASRQLAEMYSPEVIIPAQAEACGPGEAYLPTTVDSVFGDPEVVLRGPDDQVITTAPTAGDLEGLGEGYYLDFPGNPLNPGCDYERWFGSKDAPATVYARVATDPAYPGELVLQYWLFWVFNDWNDRHEGDWEMVQLRFPVATAKQALTNRPTSVAFAQHEGSEVADWSDPKLRRSGNHIAVYPAAGSHAAYFTQATWFGKSAASGFGCDTTAGPSEMITPQVVMLNSVDDGTQPWLSFTGRWGEKELSFNNGPTGPNTKDQWNAPITWQVQEGRSAAVSIPATGGIAIDAFCSLTRQGSLLFIALLDRPWAVAGAVIVTVLGVLFAVRRTTWGGSSLRPLAQRRDAGQIAVAGLRWWRKRWRFTLPLGGLILAATAGVATVQQALASPQPVPGSLTELQYPAGQWTVPLVVLSALGLFALLTLLYTAVMWAVSDDRAGDRVSLGQAVEGARTYPVAWAIVALSMFAGGFLLATVVFIVVLAFLAGRWGLAGPIAVFEGSTFTKSWSRSNALSRGQRWHVLAAMAVLTVLVIVPTSVIGALLLLLTPWPFWLTGLLTAAVSAALITAAFAGVALLYLDVKKRATPQAASTSQV